MRKLIVIAFVTLLLAACGKEQVVVEKTVEVPVEIPVEVDTSNMPAGLKSFLANDNLKALYDEWVNTFRQDTEVDMLIISFGKNVMYLNSTTAPTLPEDVINFQGYTRSGVNQYALASWYHMKASDGSAYYEEISTEPVYNEQFYDGVQYVYQILQF